MSHQPPRYSTGEYESTSQVSDAKSQPPQYFEASEVSNSYDHALGESYVQKASVATTIPTRSNHFTVHSTENENHVLLDASTSTAIFYVDNTSALSKTYLRHGDSTSGAIISLSKIAGPFVKEMITEYESKVKSGTKETLLVAEGKFHVTWSFSLKNSAYEWRSHKGVWTLTTSSTIVATYDIGRSLIIEDAYLHLTHVVISTVFSISLYARLVSERRQRALNSISGKSSTPMLGSGLLL